MRTINTLIPEIMVSGITLFLSFAVSEAASVESMVKDGNALYSKQQFDGALKKYNDAQAKAPGSDIISFNTGAAFYKKGEFPKAARYFTSALTSKDKDLERKANYNIANSKYKEGALKESAEPLASVALYKEALDYYKRAIELSEKDADARFNYELVEKRLKELQKKMKQQQQQQKQKDSQNQENKEQEQRQKGERKQEQEQNSAPAQSDQGKENNREQKQRQSDNNGKAEQGLKPQDEQRKNDEEQSGAEKPKPLPDSKDETAAEKQVEQGKERKEMTEEEAGMLLENNAPDEIFPGNIDDRGDRTSRDEVVKDW